MSNVGVIGSGEYRNKKHVTKILNQYIYTLGDRIVSGHSPRYRYDNVDVWAEEWAYIFCSHKPIIHKAKSFTKEGFFARNKLIAEQSDFLICFINKGQFKSGTWNTIKHFLKLGKKCYEKDFIIYDEYGCRWERYELPLWCNKWLI